MAHGRIFALIVLPLLAASAGLAAMDGMAWGSTQILLTGNILRKCTVDVVPDSIAANLPLTSAGAQRIRIGSVMQDCNGRTGYVLEIVSTNCLLAAPGAKLVDPIANETLPYAVESDNPTTGGSNAVVTGLLSGACTDQIARDVTHAIVHNEISTLFVTYDGAPLLSAGTYQDTLTLTLSAK